MKFFNTNPQQFIWLYCGFSMTDDHSGYYLFVCTNIDQQVFQASFRSKEQNIFCRTDFDHAIQQWHPAAGS
jgi:hypothetical protein